MTKRTKQVCSRYREAIQLLALLILLFISMRKLLGLVGFIGGVLFGLMFASKSGKEMRKELITGKDEEVLPKIGKEFVEAGKNFVSAVQDAADEPVRDMIKKGKIRGNQLVKKAKGKIDILRKKMRSGMNRKMKETAGMVKKVMNGKVAEISGDKGIKRPSSQKKTTRK